MSPWSFTIGPRSNSFHGTGKIRDTLDTKEGIRRQKLNPHPSPSRRNPLRKKKKATKKRGGYTTSDHPRSPKKIQPPPDTTLGSPTTYTSTASAWRVFEWLVRWRTLSIAGMELAPAAVEDAFAGTGKRKDIIETKSTRRERDREPVLCWLLDYR